MIISLILLILIIVCSLIAIYVHRLDEKVKDLKDMIDPYEEKMAKINGLYVQLIRAVDKQALKEFREMDAKREASNHEERLRKDMNIIADWESKLADETESESDKDYLSNMGIGRKEKLAELRDRVEKSKEGRNYYCETSETLGFGRTDKHE